MRLRRSIASVGVVKLRRERDAHMGSTPESQCDTGCDVLRTVEVSAADTEGLVVEVQGDRVSVAWNAARVCPSHTQQCIRFTGALQSRRHGKQADGFGVGFTDVDGQCLTGLATGKVLFGSVGSTRRTFHVVTGNTHQLAATLADHCLVLQCIALYTDSNRLASKHKVDSHGIQSYLRAIDVFKVGENFQILVEEIDVGGVIRAEESFGIWDFLAEGQSVGMGGAEMLTGKADVMVKDLGGSLPRPLATDYETVWKGAMRGSLSALRQLEQMAEARPPVPRSAGESPISPKIASPGKLDSPRTNALRGGSAFDSPGPDITLARLVAVLKARASRDPDVSQGQPSNTDLPGRWQPPCLVYIPAIAEQ